MAKKKEWTKTMRGTQLMSPGDVIRLMDGETPVRCKILSWLANEDGSCLASLEVLEGDRKGERFQTRLRAEEGPPTDDPDWEPGA
jgi:hypothetical protein